MKLSIVIPIFNKWNFTKSCLKDLSQLDPEKNEIVIVDNGSSDETVSGINEFLAQDNLVYIKNKENYGFAAGCNIGYHRSRGDSILFLNNDIRVKNNHKDWTSTIIDKLNVSPNSLVGPTGGKVDPKKEFQFMYETSDPKKDINYMSGWCLAATKNVWEKIRTSYIPKRGYVYPGPFSEEFGLAYFEDTDVGFRAKELNIGFEFVTIPVVHFGKQSSGQLNTHALYSNARKIFVNKWSK